MAGKASSFMAVATEGMAPGERVECLMALGVAGLPKIPKWKRQVWALCGKHPYHIYPYLSISLYLQVPEPSESPSLGAPSLMNATWLNHVEPAYFEAMNRTCAVVMSLINFIYLTYYVY